MQRTFTLDPKQLEPFEIGALLLSILAFPGSDEEELLKNAAVGLCADFVREAIKADKARASKSRTAYPHYLAIDKSGTRRRLRTFKRRLRDRMVASRMSLGFFREGLTKRDTKIPDSMKRHSINELSKLVVDESGESDAENVERRAWRDSLPVIHLAAAVQIELRRKRTAQVEVDYRLDDLKLHAAVIRRAKWHEKIVLYDQRFGKKRHQLIRIRSGPNES